MEICRFILFGFCRFMSIAKLGICQPLFFSMTFNPNILFLSFQDANGINVKSFVIVLCWDCYSPWVYALFLKYVYPLLFRLWFFHFLSSSSLILCSLHSVIESIHWVKKCTYYIFPFGSSLYLQFFCWDFLFFSLSSSTFVIVHWNIYIRDVLKYLSDSSNIGVISVLTSND